MPASRHGVQPPAHLATNPSREVIATPQCVLSIVEPNGHRSTCSLGQRPVIIGREAPAELIVSDLQVSRRHAQIAFDGSRCVVTDLGSTNGSYVNGRRIHQHALLLGEQLLLGGTRISFSVVEMPQSRPQVPVALPPRKVPDGAGPRQGPPVDIRPAPAVVAPSVQAACPRCGQPLTPEGLCPRCAAVRVSRPEAHGGLSRPRPLRRVTVSSFRHPWEIPTFIFNFLMLCAVFAVSAVFIVVVNIFNGEIGAVLDFLAFGLWCVVFTVATVVVEHQTLSRYPVVSQANYPTLHEIAQTAAARLNMRMPRMYLATDRTDFNAYAVTLPMPTVVVNRGLVEAMGPRELQFVLGHEFGHIKAWHTPLTMMLHNRLMHSAIGALMFWPSVVLRLIMLLWDRLSEQTADRAGLLACGDPGSAVRSLVLVHYGAGEASRLDVTAFVRESYRSSDWAEGIAAVGAEHPTLRKRVKGLVQYVASPAYLDATGKAASR